VSNKSLIERIEASVASLISGTGTIKSLAEAIRLNGAGLEQMPSALYSQIESLASRLDREADYDEEGFAVNLEPVISDVKIWLSKLPQ
jgi:hypothetical protein